MVGLCEISIASMDMKADRVLAVMLQAHVPATVLVDLDAKGTGAALYAVLDNVVPERAAS